MRQIIKSNSIKLPDFRKFINETVEKPEAFAIGYYSLLVSTGINSIAHLVSGMGVKDEFVNHTGDVSSTIPIILTAVILSKIPNISSRRAADIAFAATSTWITLGETVAPDLLSIGILSNRHNHADPFDIPAGIIGAAIGYVLFRSFIKAQEEDAKLSMYKENIS